jgi:hypothetical protein
MVSGDETADSYKTTADLILGKKGDKNKAINNLFKAASLYGEANKKKAIECLDDIYVNVRGSTVEFEQDQFFRYLHRLARLYEDLEEEIKAADVYLELAKEFYKQEKLSKGEKDISRLLILKNFLAYLAKALMLYDSAKKFDQILKIARAYYKEFPILQHIDSLHGELFFCYEHIIHAADMTGSRYFREYYADLDRKLRGITDYTSMEDEGEGERKGPYGTA